MRGRTPGHPAAGQKNIFQFLLKIFGKNPSGGGVGNEGKGYYPSDWNTTDKARNAELADELNEQIGVSAAQRQAMEVGSMAGWDVPGADPQTWEDHQLNGMGGMTLA